MVLDHNEIATIEKRLIEKGAPPYQEVLIELTDDVASHIELYLAEHNELDFEAALEISLKRYSKASLKQLGREKEGAIMRNYAKIEWQMIKTWFSWPKIVITCFITLAFGWALTEAKAMGRPVLLSVYFTLLFLPILRILLQGWKRWQFNRSLPRKVLALKIGINSLGVMGFVPSLLYLPQIIGEEFFQIELVDHTYYWYFQAFLIVLIWISLFAIAPILEEKGRAQAEALMAVSNG